MAPQNQYLADLANAYKLINEVKANDQVKGLQVQKPPSNEEIFQKLSLQKQFDEGQTAPDVQLPPKNTPATATNIEGGTKVTRPLVTPDIEGGGTKYSQPNQPVESVASAVRRSMSSAGTLELKPPSASTLNNYGGGGGLGKNGLLGPFGGSGLGGGGNLAADDVSPTGAGSSSANAVAVAQNPLAVKGIGGITNSFKLGGAASGVGISAVIGALDAVVHGKSPVVGALSAGGGALATGAVIGGALAVGVTGGLPAVAAVGAALGAGKLVEGLISSLLLTPAPQPKQEAPKPPPPKGTQDVDYDIYGESITDNGNPYGGYDASGKSAGKPGPQWMTTLKGPGFTVGLTGGDKGEWRVYNDAGDSTPVITYPDGSLRIYHEVATLAGAYAQSLTITSIVPHGKPAPPFPPQDLGPLTPLSDPNYVQQSVGGLNETATPPISPPPDVPLEKNKQKPKTVPIPPNTPATITPPGTTIPGSPNGTNVTVNPDGSIQVAPNGGQPYGVTTGGTEPIVIKTPGNQDVSIDPTGQTPVQGAIPNAFNPTILKPNPLKPTDPFTPTTLTPNPLKPTEPFTPTTLKPTTENPTTQNPEQTSNPLLTPNPYLTVPAAVIAGLTPLLKNILNKTNDVAQQTTPDKLATAATTGVCNSTKPGGCNAGLNENAKNASDAANAAKLNTLGIAGDAAATQTGLNQLKKAVGVGEFPATVPASLVTSGSGATAAAISIPNLARFQAWHVEQLDALMGAFAIPFNVGGKAMSIPNVAEGMAEQMGMQFAGMQNQEMLLNLCTRTIAEVGQIKQQQFKTYMAIEAIIEYLNFKHIEVQHSMPLSFVPGATDLLSLLKEATQTVSVIQYDDKVTQKTFLLDIARAAAITRAQGFRNVNGTTDQEIRAEILARIKGLNNFSDNIAQESTGTFGKDDLDAYIKEIMSQPTTGENPYACEGEEPPQITRKPPKKNP